MAVVLEDLHKLLEQCLFCADVCKSALGYSVEQWEVARRILLRCRLPTR